MDSLISKYKKEEIKKIVLESYSLSDVLRKIGYTCIARGNYNTLKKYLDDNDIDYSFFKQYHGSSAQKKDNEFFIENSSVGQATLRRRYLNGKYSEYKCSICGQLPFWNNKEMSLTLDHINGKNHDDRLENLRWVCPNCDRQLDTFGAKNKKTLNKNNNSFNMPNHVKINKKVNNFPFVNREKLKNEIRENSFDEVGKIYGCSKTTISRWCINLNLPHLRSIINNTSDDGWENENWDDIIKIEKNYPLNIHPVYMINPYSNEIVNKFNSCVEAERFLKKKLHINEVCKGNRNTSGGYKWRYVNKDYNNYVKNTKNSPKDAHSNFNEFDC